MKSPVIDQKSFLATTSSRVESSWRGVGEESSSDSPWRTSCSSPRPRRSRIKVDGLRRRSPPEVLPVPSATRNMKLSPFIGVNTSFALSLLAWISDASISSNSSPAKKKQNRGICLVRLLLQIDVISICPSQRKGDIRPLLQTVSLVRLRAFRTAFRMESPHQTRDLECFADSSNTPWNPPTIHCPDLCATIPQMSLPSLCALFFPQSHLFLICVALTYNDSRTIPHKTCQNSKELSV